MKKSIFLHIGLPRCASTLIEHLFLMPEHPGNPCLKANGILPLPSLNLALRARLTDPDWDDDFRDQLMSECIAPHLDGTDWRGIFSSDEGLTATYFGNAQSVDVLARAQFLSRLFEDFDVTVILVVRDQASFVRSLYALYLQSGSTLEFADLIKPMPENALDWFAIAEAYSDVFGRERVKVIPFGRAPYRSKSSPYKNFIDAIQGIMGIETPIDLPTAYRANPSIPTAMMAFQLRVNQELETEAAIKVADILRTGGAQLPNLGDTFMSKDQRRQFLARFADSNKKLFEIYMPDYDAEAFLPG